MPSNSILPGEASTLLNRFLAFFGRHSIEKGLRAYERSLQTSRPLFRDYYLRKRHPWWEVLGHIFALENAGKSLKRNLTPDIKGLLRDAKKITTLQESMSDAVRASYKRNLLDNENAKNYLFEISVAWHYYVKGATIEWSEDHGKQPEYLIKNKALAFNVECKRFNVDTARKIRRRDFYRLADVLLPVIRERGYGGQVAIDLPGALGHDDASLAALARQVVQVIAAGHTNGETKTSAARIELRLHKLEGEIVDLSRYYVALYARKPPHAHAIISADSVSGQPCDPIEFMLASRKAEDIVEAVRKKISKGTSQLRADRPGLIACFLEAVHWGELATLSTDSALQYMTNAELNKPHFSHVLGIAYCSEERVWECHAVENSAYQKLFFRNPRCTMATPELSAFV